MRALKSRTMYVGWAITAFQIGFCRYLLLAESWAELSTLGINVWQGITKDILLLLVIILVPWLLAQLPGKRNPSLLPSVAFALLAVPTIILLFSNVVFVRFFHRPLDFMSLQHVDALMDFDAAVLNLSGTGDFLLGFVLPLAGCLWFSKPPSASPSKRFAVVRLALGVVALPPIMVNLVMVRPGGDFTEQNEVAALTHEIVRQFKAGRWGVDMTRYDPAVVFPIAPPETVEQASVVKLARRALLPLGRGEPSAPDQERSLKQHTRFDFEFSKHLALRRIEEEIQRRVTANGRRPNIVLVIVESLRTYEMLDPVLAPRVLPFLSQLRRESLYFSRFMAYGVPPNQSAQGHFAYNCGLIPSFFSRTIPLSNPDLSIRCLPEILVESGYSTVFIQGHRKGFQGEFRFYHRHGAQYFYDASSFPAASPRIGSGVLDSEIFALANSVFRGRIRQPFYADVQTLTMHVPWGDEPLLPKLPPEVDAQVESDNQRQWLRRVMHFDQALERFFAVARKEAYFPNTIFIITGDHGFPAHLKGRHLLQVNLQRNWSPLLVYAPRYVPSGEVSTLKTHLDLPVGILQLLGLEVDHNFVSPGLFPLDRPTAFVGFQGPNALFFTDPETGDYCSTEGLYGHCLQWNRVPPQRRDWIAFGMGEEIVEYIAPDHSRAMREAQRLWLLNYLYSNDLVYPREQQTGGTGRN